MKNLIVEGRNLNWKRKLFFILLVCFPINLAGRIKLPSAYIQGLLVDYLLPTVYFTELLVLLLLIFDLIRILIQRRFRWKNLFPFLLFFLIFLPSLLTSDRLSLSIFRFAELFVWGSFAFWLTRSISWEKERRSIIKALSLGVSWVSILALAQFAKQRSIFGYYPLGEPVLYPSLGGVAKTSFFGREVLRAYGTFSHPNVLGGTIAVILPWLFAERFFLQAGLGLLGLFVSFSRLAWVCFLFGLLLLGILKAKSLWSAAGSKACFLASSKISKACFLASSKIGLVFSLPILLLVSFFLFLRQPMLSRVSTFVGPSSSDLSLVRRIELLQSAWAMIRSSPLSGVGLGLFTARLPAFGLPSGPTLFLQPVHNIFVLVAAESGLLALIALLFIFLLAVHEGWRKRRTLLLISLTQLIFLGLFDHYLYTLPQGLFLLLLTLGLTFSNVVRKRRPEAKASPS